MNLNNKITAYTSNDRKLLRYIKKNADKTKGVSLKNLNKNLNLRKEQIKDSIERLNSIYSIDIKDDEKVYLMSTPIDRVIPIEYEDGLNHFKAKSYYFEEIETTNGFLKQLALKNKLEHGTIAVTEHQTNGRGQVGKAWADKPFMSILMSAFLKIDMSIEYVQLLSTTIGLAVAETIQEHTLLEPTIKWPNDVYISGRKCAGILVEGSMMQSRLEHAIVGLGINVNYESNDFPSSVRSIATSLRMETRVIHNRMKLLNELMPKLDEYITKLENGDIEEIVNKISKLLYHRGEVLIYKGERYVIEKINNKGELVLSHVPDGEKLNISSAGDLQYAYGY